MIINSVFNNNNYPFLIILELKNLSIRAISEFGGVCSILRDTIAT
jgi:hypothetical protein